MKIITASNGKQTVKMSKSEWLSIGEKAGWTKTAGINEELGKAYQTVKDKASEFFTGKKPTTGRPTPTKPEDRRYNKKPTTPTTPTEHNLCGLKTRTEKEKREMKEKYEESKKNAPPPKFRQNLDNN